MNQSEKRQFLIRSLLQERPEYRAMGIPADTNSQRQLLRGLMNIRAPQRIGADFLKMQDAYLQGETTAKGVTDIADLTPIQPEHCLHCGACYENCPVKAVEKL